MHSRTICGTWGKAPVSIEVCFCAGDSEGEHLNSLIVFGTEKPFLQLKAQTQRSDAAGPYLPHRAWVQVQVSGSQPVLCLWQALDGGSPKAGSLSKALAQAFCDHGFSLAPQMHLFPVGEKPNLLTWIKRTFQELLHVLLLTPTSFSVFPTFPMPSHQTSYTKLKLMAGNILRSHVLF